MGRRRVYHRRGSRGRCAWRPLVVRLVLMLRVLAYSRLPYGNCCTDRSSCGFIWPTNGPGYGCRARSNFTGPAAPVRGVATDTDDELLHCPAVRPMRVVEGIYRCELVAQGDVLRALYDVIGKRRGEVVSEEMVSSTRTRRRAVACPWFASRSKARRISPSRR